MFTIDSKNVITLTKGDSASFQINIIKPDNTPYTMVVGDILTFTIKRGLDAKTAILTKTLDHLANGTVVINPIDTKRLPVSAQLPIGISYVYDIQIKLASGEVYTMIPHTPFVLDWEIADG